MNVVIQGIRVTRKTKAIATQMSLNQASSFSVIVRSPKTQSLRYMPLKAHGNKDTLHPFLTSALDGGYSQERTPLPI